jgi:hypothetical protein
MIGGKPKSPLATRLGEGFGGSRPKRKRLFLIAALLLFVPYLGSTLAASVTITGTGGSTALEFGQGNQVAITCDTSITTTINESWNSSSSTYTVGSIVLTGVNVTTALSSTANNGGCGGKIMTIKLYTGAAGSATPAVIGNGSATSVSFTVPTTDGTNAFTVSNSGTNGVTASSTISSNSATLTITLPSGLVTAADITRVSIETDNPV